MLSVLGFLAVVAPVALSFADHSISYSRPTLLSPGLVLSDAPRVPDTADEAQGAFPTDIPQIAADLYALPATDFAQVQAQVHQKAAQSEQRSDTDRIVIPKVNLNAPIVPVGINARGEMDVPDGKTNNVGWYKGGTKPGQIGSAVLDAHVYAAFENINRLQPGDDVYITTDRGTKLHFEVEESIIYKLADVPLQRLFNRKDDRRLNLITCSGKFMPSINTYDRRLIVYTKFIGEE